MDINDYPKVLEVYFPSKEGEGTPTNRTTVHSKTEHESFVNRFVNRGAIIKEVKIKTSDVKGNFILKLYYVTPMWLKVVIGYILLRLLEEFLIPLIKYKLQ